MNRHALPARLHSTTTFLSRDAMAKKEKEQKQPTANKGGGKRAVHRAAARARRKAHYAAQFTVTEKNQRRRLTRHVRSHPHDALARKLHEKRVGATDSLQLTSKGRKLLARAAEVA